MKQKIPQEGGGRGKREKRKYCYQSLSLDGSTIIPVGLFLLERLPVLKTLSKCKLAKYAQRARFRGYATREEHRNLGTGTPQRNASPPSLA